MEAIIDMNEIIKDIVIAFMITLMIMLLAYRISQKPIDGMYIQTGIDYATYGNDTVAFPKEWGNW